MKTVKFVPSVCKEDYEGYVELRRPTFDEKFDILEALGDISEQDNLTKFRSVRKLVALSKPFYVAVAIKNKTTGEEFKSIEDLETENDLHSVLLEVGNALPEGFKQLGNS